VPGAKAELAFNSPSNLREVPLGRVPSPRPDAERLTLFLLFAFAVLLYITTVGYEFVVDDNLLIISNPYVRSFHYLKEIFTQGMWSFRGVEGQSTFYRPLVLLTFLGERTLFGLRPAGFHLVNVILNALVVVLVYRMGRRLWPSGRGALWAALLFAAHPLHTENVAPVFGIGDLECAVFFLLAVLVYTRPLNSQGRLLRRRAWAAAGLFLLAVLAKELALLLPLLFVFYEHSCRSDDRAGFAERRARYAPTLLLAVVYLALRVHVFHGFAGTTSRSGLGIGAVVLSGFGLLGEHVHKLVWPHPLTIFQSFQVPQTWHEPFVVLGGAAAVFSAAAFLGLWNRARAVSFAILWFFLTLGPVLNVRWLSISACAERYLYLPSAAFCWLVGEGLARLARPRFSPRARWLLAYVLPGAVVAMASALTLARLPDWKSNYTLAVATVRLVPDAAPYHVYLGNAYRAHGQRNQARQEYLVAVALEPHLCEAYVNLAGVFMDDDRVEGARALLRRGAAATPFCADLCYAWGNIELGQGHRTLAGQLFARAIQANPYHREALNNLALLFFEEGASSTARSLLERAVRADPAFAEAHSNLGSVYARLGDDGRAEQEFRRAIQLDASNPLPFLSLAGLYEERGNFAAALETYRAILRVHPESANAQFRLGVLALKLGRVEEAQRALERAIEIQPGSALAHRQLGSAYLAAGNRSDARRALEKAVALDPGDDAARAALRELDRWAREKAAPSSH
jgi:tetratricopeptide (TPR) repeat protein